jgi:hypothetical protein
MGLDQYATAVAATSKPPFSTSSELAYWRKHNALEGWMENLYRLKGGKGQFNGKKVELTSENIDLLESVVIDDALPATVGFFFGEDSSEDPSKKEETLKFIKDARSHLELGSKVFYSSSW